jgi:hypothetical protein
MPAGRPRHHARGPGRAHACRAVAVAAAAIAVLLSAGCGATGAGAHATPVIGCGTARTAAGVPVRIQVKRGSVSCATALQVERDYAVAVQDGRAPGNGGGGPVTVNGWTCEGFTTPVVLRTGQASRCVRAGSEILAILPSPT